MFLPSWGPPIVAEHQGTGASATFATLELSPLVRHLQVHCCISDLFQKVGTWFICKRVNLIDFDFNSPIDGDWREYESYPCPLVQIWHIPQHA